MAFRVYYQDAVVRAPLGFAPEALMAERPVDVAILVPATFGLGHWEDFFRSPVEDTRSILLTDIDNFRDRLARVLPGKSWLPDIGTFFRLPVRNRPSPL